MTQPVGHLGAFHAQQLGEDRQGSVVRLEVENRKFSDPLQQKKAKQLVGKHKPISYIDVTAFRRSPAGLDVDVSQVQDSCQDPEELCPLVGQHACRHGDDVGSPPSPTDLILLHQRLTTGPERRCV